MGVIRSGKELEKQINLWQSKLKEKGVNLSSTQASDLFAQLGAPKPARSILILNFDHKRKLKKGDLDIFKMENLFKLT